MQVYRSERINDSLVVFGENLSEYMVNGMALVMGRKKAALIDTGLGFNDLIPYIRRFTNLPIMLLATHAHPDHIGGAPLFQDIHMSKLDDGIIPFAMDVNGRLSSIPPTTNNNKEFIEYGAVNIVPELPFTYQNIADGDTFDLGGVVLEAVHVPGHTPGSMCFVNRAEKYALTGDAINPLPWLFLDHSLPISECVSGVRRFIEKSKGIEQLFCGHNLKPLPQGIAQDILDACEEIVAGKTGNDKHFSVPFQMNEEVVKNAYMHPHGTATIVYNKKNI